ncbi:hypothetical protein [Streptomyces griseus]|uniref:hypothetical protein n=1 Tax=Streptomyces griseus TaxID=1911 RepID=UPI0004C69B02|nr:hypothetical protein [Streptomyces griseus]
MRSKDAFDKVAGELQAIGQQLGILTDPTIGLAALHGEHGQGRLKIQEAVLTGVTGLREENRELRRRQDKMIGDLSDTRAELRKLLDLADSLRTFLASSAPGRQPDPEPEEHPQSLAEPQEPAEQTAEPDSTIATEPQGETMDHTAPQPETTGDDQELTLKLAIEAAYRGTPIPAQPSDTHAPLPAAKRPEVTHGVLLLRAAGVASVEVVAHRDTWEWLAGIATDHAHFHAPPAVEDIKDGRVQTVLSGRSLIALLIELWNTRSAAAALGAEWALASTAYDRIANELSAVTGAGETIRIVLDDGTGHPAGD